MPRTFATFESTPGQRPDSRRWVEAQKGVGITGTTTLAAPALVGIDRTGHYLGPGLPVLAIGDLAASGKVMRVELLVDVPRSQTGGTTLVRVIMPLSSALSPQAPIPGSAPDPLSSLQYLTVDLRRVGDDMSLGAFLTDPGELVFGRYPSNLCIANSILPDARDDAGRGLLTVECGPRYIRAWWTAGPTTTRFRRRTPDLGAVVPWIELEAWGMCTEFGKIRQVAVYIRSNDQDDLEFDMAPPMPAVIELEAEDDLPEHFQPGNRDRLGLIRYEMPHQTKRRRGVAMLTLAGEGSTGRISDTFCPRLDEEQSLIGLPDGESTVLTMTSLADGLAGAPSESVETLVEEDPIPGPGAGIGSGRPSLSSGGELAFFAPEARQQSAIVDEEQDYQSNSGAKEEYAQTSNRTRRSWSLTLPMRPAIHLRRAEIVMALSSSSRPIWVRPPLEGRPIAGFCTPMTHSIEGVNICRAHFVVEES